MTFNSEVELCQSYCESHRTALVTERPVGKELVKEHAPEGLEGARSLQADLTSKDVSSGGEVILVECKLEFGHRAIGQLLLYEWLLRYDARTRAQPINSVDRRLALGKKPQKVIPTICYDLSIDPQIWASGGWQSIASGALLDGRNRYSDTKITNYLSDNSASSLNSSSEENVLETSILDEIPGIENEHLYREIPVGANVFIQQGNIGFSADVIGYAPRLSSFYVIEIKEQPSVGELQKAIGQSVNYSSLFRYDWGLSIGDVIPIVVIDQAPWITDVYRNSRYDSKQEMFEQALSNTDEPVILMNEVQVHK